jgi:hypothetical protein
MLVFFHTVLMLLGLLVFWLGDTLAQDPLTATNADFGVADGNVILRNVEIAPEAGPVQSLSTQRYRWRIV